MNARSSPHSFTKAEYTELLRAAQKPCGSAASERCLMAPFAPRVDCACAPLLDENGGLPYYAIAVLPVKAAFQQNSPKA